MKFLVKDYLGRWSICGKEYTCGNSATAKITSGDGAGMEARGSIEYSDSKDGYYFISDNGQLIKSMTDITVKSDKDFFPLVKNSSGRWQVKEQGLKEGSKLYIWLDERKWQLCIVKFDKEKAEYYAVTVSKFNNKNSPSKLPAKATIIIDETGSQKDIKKSDVNKYAKTRRQMWG